MAGSIDDEFRLLDELPFKESSDLSEDDYTINLHPAARAKLNQISKETGKTPEEILYEMFYERLAVIGLTESHIKIRIYGNTSYPEFD